MDAWRRGDLEAQLAEIDASAPRRGGTLRVQVYSRLPSLNPVTHSDFWLSRIIKPHVYESLVTLDPADHPRYRHVPRLAERWEITDEGRTYTFHLRHGVAWHDGKELTARDVVATFDKVTDTASGAVALRSYMDGVVDYVALGSHTVRFRFEDVRSDRLDNIFAEVPIQPAHVIEGLSGEQYDDPAINPLFDGPVGTGPLRFHSWHDDRLVLVRNESYWGREAYVDSIEFIFVATPEEALGLALRGELDVVTRIPSPEWVQMDESRFHPRFFRSRFYDINYAWIGWNQARPLFADARTRRALTMLVDRSRIIREIGLGLTLPTNCHFYYAHPACDGLPEPLPFDPSGAAELLDEAGWQDSDGDGLRDRDGVPFAFEFMVPASSEEAFEMGRVMQRDLSDAGIRMEIVRVEWNEFTASLRDREFDSVTLLWGSTGPRSDPSFIWHSDSISGRANYVGFSNQEADALLDEARRELDHERRIQLLRRFGRVLVREQPYTWLYVRPTLTLLSRRIRGARASTLYWQWPDLWVDDEPGDDGRVTSERSGAHRP